LPGGLLIQNEYLVLGCLLLWMVGLTNAYNFMDGCDGIAGGQALMAGLGWVMLTLCFPINTEVMIYGAVIAGTATGFLCYNWQPSKLFLGDVGSAFLGFTFAWMPLLAADIAEDIALTLGAGALLLWPFIMDASFTFGRRLLRGENVFKAHRSHLYQRLVLSGWSHARVSLLYMGLAITGWPLAWVWSTGHAWVIVLCPSVVLVLFLALCLLVRAVENKTTQIPKSVQ
ncbi:MAG: glycosyl transferase, partial [Verrucomicrobiota bacterium]|nr:glycosyl transferase [Verrucomicrobiota bacterium]